MRSLVLSVSLVLGLCGSAHAAVAARAATPARPAAKSFPLAGARPDEVKAALGEPAVASEEGRGALWTYRLTDCALMVFFKDEGSGLRVSSLGTGPRRRAETPPDAERCMAGEKR